MHPIKLLIKAAAKTATLNSGGRGGKPLFDSIDAAHSLSGLNPVLSSIAYWRFCGDNNQYSKVMGNLATKAMRHCRENNYKFKNTTIQRLAKAALLQLEQPVCGECLGAPVSIPHDRDDPIVCGKCSGTGQQQLSIRAIAGVCEVDKRAITANHLDTYHTLVAYLKECEDRIISHVRERTEC